MIKKRKIMAIVLSFLLTCTAFAGCSPRSNDSSERTQIISIATTQPEDHPISIALRAFQDHIQKNLDGRYVVKIYYNSIMGDNSQALELLQMGTLNFVATSGSNLESFDDTYKIFGVPYLFKDEESFRECMKDEEFSRAIYDCTVDKGIQGVTWFANGVNNIYSTRGIYTPDDLKGMKFRIQSSEANVKMAQAFDAAAVVMAYGEVYTALQNHVIDAAANPEMALISVKHGEVAKYYSRTEHQIFTDMLIANCDFMNSLAPEDRAVFEEGFKLCTDIEVEEWDKQIEECIVAAEDMGVEFIDVDKSLFEAKQKSVQEELLNDYEQLQPLYQRVQKIQKGDGE